MANEGRVLVAYHERYLVVARSMLDGLVTDADIGHWHEGRTVTLADFSRLDHVVLTRFDSIVVLAGPPPGNEAVRKVCNDVATRFTTEARDKVRIEFALAHSHRMIANPEFVVDAGRTDVQT